MDAMQKRKMWKVAIAHFVLTLFVALLMILLPYPNRRAGDFYYHIALFEAYSDFLKNFLFLLQPLPLLVVLIFQQMELHFALPNHPLWLVVPIFYGVLLISSLLWSFCFGWLYIKFTNWLNHFPVLGKRVF
jgi:hypothetical protein